MVSANLADALRDPTSQLRELFHVTGHEARDFPAVVTRHFAGIFVSDDAFQEVKRLSYIVEPTALTAT